MGSILRSYFFNLLYNTIMNEAKEFKDRIVSLLMNDLNTLEMFNERLKKCVTDREYDQLALDTDEMIAITAKYISDFDLSK
jgi:CO dehydrogenase/acetyl-CoA synthase delta subunit